MSRPAPGGIWQGDDPRRAVVHRPLDLFRAPFCGVGSYDAEVSAARSGDVANFHLLRAFETSSIARDRS
jgi:hypothetical protein